MNNAFTLPIAKMFDNPASFPPPEIKEGKGANLGKKSQRSLVPPQTRVNPDKVPNTSAWKALKICQCLCPILKPVNSICGWSSGSRDGATENHLSGSLNNTKNRI